jgi:Fic-DOC domain mobile mystery protein B
VAQPIDLSGPSVSKRRNFPIRVVPISGATSHAWDLWGNRRENVIAGANCGFARADDTALRGERSELNEAEQANILEAEDWAFARNRDVLGEGFMNDLHKRMYGNVWRWAGQYRTSGKNIGVDAYRIPTELRQLLDDCRYWIGHDTYEPDEIAARLHHKLVWIRPYPNGNGRHARLAADLLLTSLGRARFSWGGDSLIGASELRARYVAALLELSLLALHTAAE